MSSLIEGYNYDIFISYRQKDNKYDSWVTEFVDNLKCELESMFKDEVSLYFDINPSDYLLETHDVDASLINKLKCLIFIPVISRTYCDPKSFAREHELKIFKNNASCDRFGLKIKLTGGNFANRILPIRIHDLDAADIRLFEALTGGAMRSIDFVYKETGVNRQLRAKDDDLVKSAGHILYRDQINKTALAVKEIIESMIQIDDQKKTVTEEVSENISESKETEIAILEKLESVQEEGKNRKLSVKVKYYTLVTILILFALFSTFLVISRRSKVKWALESGIPEISKMINAGNYSEAFYSAQKIEKYIPDDPELKKLWPSFSNRISIKSEPSGAMIFRRDYEGKDSTWIYVGTTPIDSTYFPLGFSSIKVVKEGYETIYDASNSTLLSIRNYLLDSIGSLPLNMIHIPTVRISINPSGEYKSVEIKDFLIDKYEVTNKLFKGFIMKGGYQDSAYWKYTIYRDGRVLKWTEAMHLFVDKTGRNGPSTWEAGDYPKGEDNFPVGGISWYEAAAFAEYSGMSLPTYYHWRRAADLDYRLILPRLILTGDGVWGISFVIPESNYSMKGPAPVGSYNGMTAYGTMDMMGNMREWVLNESTPGGQKFILGGGWSDPTYIGVEGYYQPPLDRSQINGFRCVKYMHIGDDLKNLIEPIEKARVRDYMHEKPVSDQQFSLFKRMYLYDKTDLNPKIESEDTGENDWIKQKITYNAAYGNERIIAYLFLPKAFKPPYQTIVYFPGSSASEMLSSKSLLGMMNIDYIIKNGRAVLYPVYKGTYERRFDAASIADSYVAEREHLNPWVVRCLDESGLPGEHKEEDSSSFFWLITLGCKDL